MLEHNKAYCSNHRDTLVALRGETVKGIIENHKGKTYLIFESGFSLWFNRNGSFAVSTDDEVDKIITEQTHQLRATRIKLTELLELAGEETGGLFNERAGNTLSNM